MVTLTSGVVTFLLSDIEDSTRFWLEHRNVMPHAVARHDLIVATRVKEGDGVLVKPRGEGDSHFAVFGRPSSAVLTAAVLQRALIDELWPNDLRLRVRIALHTGEADLRDGDYYGLAPNRCARLRSMAHGGQIVLSRAIVELIADALPDGLTLRSLGTHRLRRFDRAEEVSQLCGVGLPDDFPPLVSLGPAAHDIVTILVADVARSAQLASDLGNRQYRKWLDQHDNVMQVELQRFGGHLWEFVEDSVVASFESPHRAIDCARGMRDGVAKLGGELKVGLHSGEVEVRGDRLHGIAVDIAAEVSRLAGGREILLSRTLSDLLLGSGVLLDDRGDVTLPGITGQWHLFALID